MTANHSSRLFFTASGCLTLKGMEAYLRKGLPPEDKLNADRHLNSCDLCRDALEGLSGTEDHTTYFNAVSDLNIRLGKAYKQKTNTVIRKKNWAGNLHYWTAAATIILLFGLFISLNSLFRQKTMRETGQQIEVRQKLLPPKPVSPVSDDVIIQQAEPEGDEKTALPAHEEELIIPINEKPGLPARSDKDANQPAMIQNDLRSGDTSLEAFLQEDEKPVVRQEDGDRYADIASNLPAEYYLAEVIVSKSSYNAEAVGMISSRETSRKMALKNTQDETLRVEGPNIRIPATDEPNKDHQNASTHFFRTVESMPEFPGGYQGLHEYLSLHLVFPDEAKEKLIMGRVLLSFVIDESGNAKDVKVTRGIGGGCDEEAARVIRSMPPWEPATQNGKAVPVRFTLPIYFKLI